MPISVASLYGHTGLPALRGSTHTAKPCLLSGNTVQLSSLSGLNVLLFLPAQHHAAAMPASQHMQHQAGMPACSRLPCRIRP